jgi:hypothetical protein
LASQFFVYLYRSASGVSKYVDYGMNVDRALAHAGASHNAALRAWLDEGQFDVSVAGPYRDETEEKAGCAGSSTGRRATGRSSCRY